MRNEEFLRRWVSLKKCCIKKLLWPQNSKPSIRRHSANISFTIINTSYTIRQNDLLSLGNDKAIQCFKWNNIFVISVIYDKIRYLIDNNWIIVWFLSRNLKAYIRPKLVGPQFSQFLYNWLSQWLIKVTTDYTNDTEATTFSCQKRYSITFL
jgi:hypothetical protein